MKQAIRRTPNHTTMNILMLGWEFPPHITGGLGTACHGLLTGLHRLGSTHTTFVLPELHGQEDRHLANMVRIYESDTPRETLQLAGLQRSDFADDAAFLDAYVHAYGSRSLFTPSGLADFKDNEEDLLDIDESLFGRPGPYSGTSIGEALAYASHMPDLIERGCAFDIIHAHDWLTLLAGAEAKRITGKPLVTHIHSTEVDRSGAQCDNDIFLVEQFGMSVADRVITVSQLTRDIIISRYGIDSRKVVVVHNAAEFPPMPLTPPAHMNQQVVSFIGRITYQKGPKYFVEAARLIAQRVDNVRFIMAGTGDQLPMIKALVSALGLRDRFEFPGFLNSDEVRNLLAKSTVYVMPSVSEPFGIGALEAIHAGIPVVISDRAGVSEVVRHMIKVDVEDSEAIADAVTSLLLDPALATHLKKAAKEEANRHNWTAVANQLVELYGCLASDARQEIHQGIDG